MKNCELCQKEIPDDFQNLLCLECYGKSEQEKLVRQQMEKEERKATGVPELEDIHKLDAQPHVPVGGIVNPEYTPNPQQDEIDMLRRNIAQYEKTGLWLWKATRTMYTFIKDSFRDIVVNHPQYPKFIWKPTVVDVGCGTGLGSNILSQEADFVWGIDKCEKSVKFANEMFARQKNNIYYTPEIRYDVIDAENPPPNVDMKFDVVVCLEVFEHLANHERLLQFLKFLCHPAIASRKTGLEALPASYVWISTPNRNNKHIGQDHPTNKYHVKEMTSQEFVAVLKQHFQDVKLFNSAGVPCPEDTNHTPILALCQNII